MQNNIPGKKYLIWIGIDTGVNTGQSVWNSVEKKLVSVRSLMIHEAMEVVRDMQKYFPDQVFVRVEDARKRTWLPQSKGRAQLQGAGSIKRDASIWEAFLKDLKIPYELVAPKNNKTKVSADYFKKLTGWEKQTNEHARDSAMLVYGK